MGGKNTILNEEFKKRDSLLVGKAMKNRGERKNNFKKEKADVGRESAFIIFNIPDTKIGSLLY